MQLIYSKNFANRKSEFAFFMENLCKLHLFIKENEKKNNKNQDSTDFPFKLFIDQYIFPEYQQNFSKGNDLSIERIQVFYQNYNTYENPTVCLFSENDDLLKHVKF